MSEQSLIPSKDEMAVIKEYVAIAKQTGKYKHLATGGVSEDGAIMLIFLTAREFGIPLMSALNGGVQLVKGKVELSVHMKTYKILQGGNKLKSWYSDDYKTCYVEGTRRDTGHSAIESFSWDDAVRAGLTNGDSWKKYPKEMLYARAMSRISNRLFADVVGGPTYARGEIDPVAMEVKDVEPVNTSICVSIEDDQAEKVLEINEDNLDMMILELYKLFPGDDRSFSDFVAERAEKAKVSLSQMYKAMYNSIDAVPEKFNEWKKEKEKADE